MRPALGTAALGAALLAAGFLLDAEPLPVAGVALLVLAAGAAAWVGVAARGATVERTLSTRRVVEDEPVDVRIVVRSRRSLPGGEVREPLLVAPAPVGALRRRARIRIRARFSRRGVRVLEPPVLAVADPLGLARRRVAGGGPDRLLVLPSTHPVLAPGRTAGADGWSGPTTALLAAAETEIDGLRPYREGAPAGRIHWPALARNAGLLERHLRAETDARPVVALDARAPARPEDLDAAVRAAASLTLALGRASGCALLLPGDRRARLLEPDLSAWPDLHARLALVEAGAGPALGALGARRGPVYYVAARPLTRPPAALARAAAGRCLLVVPADLPGRTPSFAVAGCHGYPARARGRLAA